MQIIISHFELQFHYVHAILLKPVGDCDKLKKLLGNPHLREMLREVDGAASAQVAMRRAMLEPIFTEFADAVLGVVEPDMEASTSPPSRKQESL